MMIALPSPNSEVGLAEFDDKLYELLPEKLTYTRRNWLEELLVPLGFGACDQSRVFHSLHRLRAVGRVELDKDGRSSGGHYRRRDQLRPRQATISKIS